MDCITRLKVFPHEYGIAVFGPQGGFGDLAYPSLAGIPVHVAR
jgi:hypothetical protein